MVKGILIRIGIDMGVGGTLAPIFEDGSFEYIPFPEEEGEKEGKLTYSKIKGRYKGVLSDYLAEKHKNWIPHYDPEFKTPSYGDPTTKRNSLIKLEKGDILVFHAGLRAFKNENYPSRANYIIGCFVVDRVVDFSKIQDHKIFKKEWNLLQNNIHIGYRKEKDCLVVVGHKEKSGLLAQAIPFTEMKPDAKGRPTVAITEKWEDTLGIKGFVQRSTPRWIKEEGCKNLLEIFDKAEKKGDKYDNS